MMTNERKAVLFDQAMDWIYKQLSYADELEISEALEDIGFTEDEIDQVLNQDTDEGDDD